MANPEGIYVCDADELAAGEALTFDPDITGANADITVFRDGDELYALDDLCSHQNVSLADGFIESGRIECPLHSAEFCLKTGAALSLPAVQPVAAHRLEVRDGKVYIYPGEAPAGA